MIGLINCCSYDFLSYREDVYILFDDKIREIGPMSAFDPTSVAEAVDCKRALVLPSLINGHSHIYSTFARGLSLSFAPKNFVEILEQLWWRLDSELNLDNTYNSAVVYGTEALQNGVTTHIDHHASGKDIVGSLKSLEKGLCKAVGLRGSFCFETSDRFDIEQCIDENLQRMKDFGGLFGMHASMTLEDKTLEKVLKAKRDNQSKRVIEDGETGIGLPMPVHIHIAESSMDEAQCYQKHHMSIIERLNRYDLLDQGSLLAHCIHINETEVKIIKDKGCVVVMNCTSNMNNGVGLPNYHLFKKYGIPVILGNDGISTSMTTEWLSLYYGMHHQYKDIKAFTLEDLNEVIRDTYEYASDLLNCRLGRIEEGYESDLLMIPYEPSTPIDKDNVMGHLFFGLANSFRPKHVWCKGQWLLKDYNVKGDAKERYNLARQSSKRLWERLMNDEKKIFRGDI